MQESVKSAIPVIIIFAPTACGKTARAGEIFGSGSLSLLKGRGEVISADSQAVYKEMDIGTAKPTAEECALIPHHLINLVSPDVQFGLGEWMTAADCACEQIWRGSGGHVFPVVVGGTGFYVRNFILGQPSTPQSNPQIRAQLSKRMEQEGVDALYALLVQIDPQSAQKINGHDAYRIQRALEVYYSCGRPLSSFELPEHPRDRYSFCTIILTREKEQLYTLIDDRVEMMFSRGLEEEVSRLVAQGYTENSPGMKAIGYSEFFIPPRQILQQHGNNWLFTKNIVEGTEPLTAAQTREIIKEQIKLDSRHYAKKQYTFMRDIPGAVCIDADDTEKILATILSFCNKVSS